MNKAHELLEQKLSWYQAWHENPFTKVVHWVSFLGVLFIFANLSLSSIEIVSVEMSAFDNVANSVSSQVRVTKKPTGVVQDHVLVKFKDSVSQNKKNEIFAKHGLSEKSEISGIKVKLVKISPNDTPEEVVDRLNAQHGDSIEFAEIDAIMSLDYVPNDPQYSAGWQFPKMSAESAWDVSVGSPSVVIAILDTGTDCTHEDLASRCVSGWNFYDNNSNTSDVYGHGTAVAGSAAAAGDNGIGIASPCYNCKIMPIRITDTGGSSMWSTTATAMTYAVDKGVKVVNLSSGPIGGTILSAAQYVMNKGGVFVNSAGNSSVNSTASDDQYVIKVSAVDGNDNLYGWSNYGTDIDLAGAGCVTTTANGGGYRSACGTSFSAPVVSGVAGLIFSRNSSLSGAQVRNILKSNTNDIYTPGFDIYSGYGTPNMFTAVSAAGTGSVPDTSSPTTPTLSGSVGSATKINLSWSPSSDNIGVVGYNVFRGESKVASVSGTSYSDTSVSPTSTYTYFVTAYDLAGNVSGPSNTISLTTPILVVTVTITNKQVANKTGTTATITWTTNINSTSSVSYGKSSSTMTSSATDSLNSKTHTVTLTGLSNLTTYYYRINVNSSDGLSSLVSPVSTFKTSKK